MIKLVCGKYTYTIPIEIVVITCVIVTDKKDEVSQEKIEETEGSESKKGIRELL